MDNAFVAAVTARVGDITEDQVRRVLAAVDQVQEGATVGTLMQDPETQAIAVRVNQSGVPVWKVTTMNGDSWVDTQPRLDGWVTLTGE